MREKAPTSIAEAAVAVADTEEARAFLNAVLSDDEYAHLERRWMAIAAGVSVTRAGALRRADRPILDLILARGTKRVAPPEKTVAY
jgi:DNA-binding phage protein